MKNQKQENFNCNEKEWYRERIVDMVGQIHDSKFLRRIFISLRDYLKEKK